MRVRGQQSGAWRLAALNQDEGDRHKQRNERDPGPPEGPAMTRRIRGHHPVRTMTYLEFRIRSDHPPTAPRTPKNTEHPPLTGVARTHLGDVKLPEKTPHPEAFTRPCNRVAIV